MDIQAQYEKDLEELKRLEAAESEQPEETEEELPEPVPEEDVPEETPETPEVKVEEPIEPPKDHKAWAEQRRENAALKRKLAEQDEKINQLLNPKPVQINDDPEPNKEEEPVAWLEWDNRQLRKQVNQIKEVTQEDIQKRREQERRQQAAREFTAYGNRFKATVPDYEEVGSHAISQIRQSFLNIAPNLDESKLNELTANHILGMAAQAVRNGLDPAEEIYHTFKSQFGVPVRNEPREEKKLDLDRLDKSRKKSASSLVGGGQGGSIPLTVKSAVTTMTNGEFAALSPSQLRELESQLR